MTLINIICTTLLAVRALSKPSNGSTIPFVHAVYRLYRRVTRHSLTASYLSLSAERFCPPPCRMEDLQPSQQHQRRILSKGGALR